MAEEHESGKWGDYLSSGEKILEEYRIGLYDLLATDRRVICLKRFPKSFTEVRYADIQGLEHRTLIDWQHLTKALVFLALAAYVYTGSPLAGSTALSGFVDDVFRNYLPELTVISAGKLVVLVDAILFVVGLSHLGGFLISTQGDLRISLKDRSPIKIKTGLTRGVKDFIRVIEARMVVEAVEPPVEPVVEEAPTKDSMLEELYGRLKSETTDLGPHSIVLVSSKSEDHMNVVVALLRLLRSDWHQSGIYVSVSRPYEQILDTMKSREVDMENIVFIDCISHMAGKVPSETTNTVFVENPSSLEEIGMYADKLLVRLPEPKFIFLDSLSSLLIYNDQKSVKEFTHFMINKMRLEGLGGVILSIEKEEVKDLVQTIVPMCDKEIRF